MKRKKSRARRSLKSVSLLDFAKTKKKLKKILKKKRTMRKRVRKMTKTSDSYQMSGFSIQF